MTSVASVPVNEPLLNGNEKKYLLDCIETGWISSEGPRIKEFETSFAAKVKRKHGIAVANGSVAIDAAIVAFKIGAGDEVILPTFTIISCAASIVRAGATPVVVDCDPRTWNMRAEDVARKISPRTKAIMIVHLYGLPVDADPILELARKHGLKVIEDAAEMHGQTYRGRPCGSLGDLSIFSFYPNKHVTTGEGGMLVCDDDGIAERCRSLRNLCFKPGGRRFVHEELGWNFRMTNLQAALGVAQLERLDEFVQIKRKIGARYQAAFCEMKDLELPPVKTDYADNIYWVYGMVLADHVPFDAEVAMQKLGAEGIGTRPFFWNMHEQPVFKNLGLFNGESYPHAERIARRGFYIPSGMALTDAQQDRVIEVMRKLFR